MEYLLLLLSAFLAFAKKMAVLVCLSALVFVNSALATEIVAWNTLGFAEGARETILALDEESAPDVLITLESGLNNIGKEGLAEHLDDLYPYSDFTSYHPTKAVPNGIMIFSKYPFEKIVVENLDWTHGRQNYREKWEAKTLRARQFDRPYIVYRLDINGEVLNLIPVHILNPWPYYIQKNGKLVSGLNFFVNADNPIFNQLSTLSQKYLEDFESVEEPVLVLGDFNVPSRLMGFGTLLEALMKNVGLKEVIGPSPATFPDYNMKIDHIFSNGLARVGCSQVLDWKGSDHFPVKIVLD